MTCHRMVTIAMEFYTDYGCRFSNRIYGYYTIQTFWSAFLSFETSCICVITKLELQKRKLKLFIHYLKKLNMGFISLR
jgi:hypothetical protein